MKNNLFLFLSLVFTILSMSIFFSCASDKLPAPTLDACDSLGLSNLTYDADLKTIIDTKCASPGCHVSGFNSGNFTNYAGMISRLENDQFRNRSVVMQDMPPNGSPALTEDERQMIDCWILSGFPEN